MSRWWMRNKESGEPIIITGRVAVSKDHGRYGMGYRDAARVITALKSSGELIKTDLVWGQIELVNVNGIVMEDMVTFPVEIGFALRHKTELWYWSEPNHGRVWYSRPGDVEGIWRRVETRYSREDDREEPRTPAQQNMVMVRCQDGSNVESLPNWFV